MIETREVRLPADLCEAAEKKFGAKFANVEDLLVFVLQDLLRDDASRFDQAELQLVEQRLRDLGYM
jgi:hypothetical protein